MPTDEELALSVQQGNPEALTALIERHHSPLLGFLYRMTASRGQTGDRALAEDLVQEAFLRVLRRIGQYRYPRPFKPWLYAIATNLASDHYKQAEMRRTDSAPDDDPLWPAAEGLAANPQTALLAGDEARQVAAAVTALPAHQREAVILRYYQDLTLAEIAAVLDVPVGTVKSRLSLGLGRLRDMLESK